VSNIYQRKEDAERYDSARELPGETSALWMDKLASLVQQKFISQVLDLGGGTGRFAAMLQKVYKCPVITLDPSIAMLKQGLNRGLNSIHWISGSAEYIPLDRGSIDLVWLSQVYHHLKNRSLAFQEVSRVLKPTGFLAIRNGTWENDSELKWSKCFPEAKQLDARRMPFQRDITRFVCQQGFVLIEVQTVNQLYASSYREYYDKISQRGLSPLISISDEAFNAGLKRLRDWAASQPADQPVYEPVDLFVFQKQ
jgi:ubiquinone/menaquinone biosynthesis C-methylase UbiE